MKLEIFKESAQDVTRLALIEEGGYIKLAVVDECGDVVNCGYILKITSRGLTLYEGFNDNNNLGIATEDGYIAVHKD